MNFDKIYEGFGDIGNGFCKIGEGFLEPNPIVKQTDNCPLCGSVLKKDQEEKYDYWCSTCKKGFQESDLHNAIPSGEESEAETENPVIDQPVEEPLERPAESNAVPCLYVFAALVPDSELKNWYIESGMQHQFTEQFQEILLQNNVWIGVAEESLLDDLKQYFRDNAKQSDDIFMFIVESQAGAFRKKIENKEFYPADLQDLFKRFVQEQAYIIEFTPVDSEIEILSENSPFNIHFIRP